MMTPKQLAWLFLIFAIFTEVAGITSMKLSAGFSHLIPSIAIFIFYGLSLGFLMLSLKHLEIGFAYALWSGLGAFLIFLIGIFVFQESLTPIKTVSLMFIIAGIIGLKQV